MNRLLLCWTVLFLFVGASVSQAGIVSVDLLGYNDPTDGGITSSRSAWDEVKEVENYASDPDMTASGSITVFNVSPPAPWNSGLWLRSAGSYVEATFDNAPTNTLFVQFESDSNDGIADFYLDGSATVDYSVNTWNAGWFAAVLHLDTLGSHTLRVQTRTPDLAIDAMGATALITDVIPEPSSVLVWAILLFGSATAWRRRRRAT